jgi:DNA-binding GntR family transcriptional regulator
VQRVSLTDQVVIAVRDDIIEGMLAPGTSLREQALSERFDVGRSTIREAIKVLVGEGLVTHEHHRGAIVTRHTAEDVDDLLAARIMIERHVAANPAERGRGADEALTAMRDAVAVRDWRAAAKADERFHHALVADLGSPRITAFHAQLQGEMRLLLVSADRDEFEVDKVDEHARLLELARSGDRDAYLRAAIHHVTRSRSQLLRVAEGR